MATKTNTNTNTTIQIQKHCGDILQIGGIMFPNTTPFRNVTHPAFAICNEIEMAYEYYFH